ncbi:MAG TPA: hypothetical protein VN843_18070 [Anaerolineales bacterium]|nr:hypothetical protein [Anaerolineales bacterium]
MPDPALTFPTDDLMFALGFEAGRMWAEIRAAPDYDEIDVIVHIENAEILLRISEATRRPLRIKELSFVHDDIWSKDNVWMQAVFGQVTTE